MNRCLVLIASVVLTFVAISSAASAGASDWTRIAQGASLGAEALSGPDEAGGTSIAPWATIPSPGIFAFAHVGF